MILLVDVEHLVRNESGAGGALADHISSGSSPDRRPLVEGLYS